MAYIPYEEMDSGTIEQVRKSEQEAYERGRKEMLDIAVKECQKWDRNMRESTGRAIAYNIRMAAKRK